MIVQIIAVFSANYNIISNNEIQITDKILHITFVKKLHDANLVFITFILFRLWYECLDLPQSEIPSSFDELRRSLDTVFRRANARLIEIRKKRLVIFIDAVNQMDDEGKIDFKRIVQY